MKITKINVDDDSLLAQPEKPAETATVKKSASVTVAPPATEVIDLYIAKACPNPRWVIGDLGGFRVNVKCPPKLSRSLVRKTVKVRVTRNGDETHYTYEP
jgi:hypothetical protein